MSDFKRRIELIDSETGVIQDWYEHNCHEFMQINKGDKIRALSGKYVFEVVEIMHTYLGSDRHVKVFFVSVSSSEFSHHIKTRP